MNISELEPATIEQSGPGRTWQQRSGRGVPDTIFPEGDVGDSGIGEETVLGDENI